MRILLLVIFLFVVNCKFNKKKIKLLKNLKIELFKIPTDVDGYLDLRETLIKAKELGFYRIFLESGMKLVISFLRKNLVDDLNLFISNKNLGKNGKNNIKRELKFFLKNNIKLENISFKHYGSNEKTLKEISMDIPAHSIVGIAGITGSGKTTLVDMIAGLLTPDSGQILIDNKQMYGKLSRTWQNNLGYIPQSSFLANDTIINNVALGVNEKDIEINKIKEIADITQISTFIENNLPNKYQTLVGERGIRLSGGQRQLLTIARALYSEPDVLIMDEATSSLDGITEEKLIHSIRKNFRFKTIIMIAHRLSTLKECDNIFLMDKGKVVDSGSYDYLIKNNLIFKQMSRENKTKFDDL